MAPIGLELSSNVYKTTYRAAVAAGKNRLKASAREYSKLADIGTEKPMETKMLIKRAKKDYLHDLSKVQDNPIGVLFQKVNYYKTLIELNLNGGYRNAKKAINDSAKELYPKTFKQREKLIENGKVSIENSTDTKTRLENLNIKPDSIIAE